MDRPGRWVGQHSAVAFGYDGNMWYQCLINVQSVTLFCYGLHAFCLFFLFSLVSEDLLAGGDFREEISKTGKEGCRCHHGWIVPVNQGEPVCRRQKSSKRCRCGPGQLCASWASG